MTDKAAELEKINEQLECAILELHDLMAKWEALRYRLTNDEEDE